VQIRFARGENGSVNNILINECIELKKLKLWARPLSPNQTLIFFDYNEILSTMVSFIKNK
jgi:hypothetical protein